MSWVGAGGSDWATHCVTCPASRSGDITRRNHQNGRALFLCTRFAHCGATVAQFWSSNTCQCSWEEERSRFRLHLLLFGGTSLVEDSTRCQFNLQGVCSVCRCKVWTTTCRVVVEVSRCEVQLARCEVQWAKSGSTCASLVTPALSNLPDELIVPEKIC